MHESKRDHLYDQSEWKHYEVTLYELVGLLATEVVLGRPFVKRFALSYRTVVMSVMSCLSVMYVTLVFCGQTVGWIKMKLGTEVGLGPGHIV